jgi:hypothetical protein
MLDHQQLPDLLILHLLLLTIGRVLHLVDSHLLARVKSIRAIQDGA